MNKDSTEAVTLRDYFESKLVEIERRLVFLNDLQRYMATERERFVTRELHDRLQYEVEKLARNVVATNTKISTWFMIVAGAYGLIQIGLSALFYHLFKQ